jgi:hypothetical protein
VPVIIFAFCIVLPPSKNIPDKQCVPAAITIRQVKKEGIKEK